jgi:hypothetical protein
MCVCIQGAYGVKLYGYIRRLFCRYPLTNKHGLTYTHVHKWFPFTPHMDKLYMHIGGQL